MVEFVIMAKQIAIMTTKETFGAIKKNSLVVKINLFMVKITHILKHLRIRDEYQFVPVISVYCSKNKAGKQAQRDSGYSRIISPAG